MKTSAERTRATAEQRLQRIRSEISGLQHICSGTLSHQTRRCGKANCACAGDPSARHGPYYVWSRRENGRQVNTMLPGEVALLFAEAVKNYRRLRSLLRAWERESACAMVAGCVQKSSGDKRLRTKANLPGQRKPNARR